MTVLSIDGLEPAASPSHREIASLLAMDRTTLTANLKPLDRRGLLVVIVDPKDRRGRHVKLNENGRD